MMHHRVLPLLYAVICVHGCVAVATSLPRPFALPKVPTTDAGLEFLDPTLPPLILPSQAPKCSVLILRHDFAGDDVGSTAVSADYAQPEGCPAPWTRVVLKLEFSASGQHADRVAAVWIGGAEILRTTTPFAVAPGTFWTVHKDVTRYTALLRLHTGGRNATVAVTLDASRSAAATALPGVLAANVSLHFYRGPVGTEVSRAASPTVKGLYREPADLIIPITNSSGADAGWFRVEDESEKPSKLVTIPRNTYRAVLEVFASSHGDDESWYANPLREYSYLKSGVGVTKTNGGYRQVLTEIDGRFAGGHIPLAVIYPGAINPYFWSPVTAIGAFDMPSYHLELTPFLSLLLDGQPHEIGLGVKCSQSYWLLSANLHLWTDQWSDAVAAGLVDYRAPPVRLTRSAEWRNRDGSSEIDGEGLVKFIGWVSSSQGNLTTMVRQKVTFKSQVAVQNRGAVTQVEMINKERMDVGVRRDRQVLGRVQLFVEAPLQVQATSVTAAGGAVFEKTRLYHELQEAMNSNERAVVTASTMTDRQDAEGSALMHEGSPVWGSATTRSSYKYRDENSCYLRTVNAGGGVVKYDVSSPSCVAVSDA